MQGWKITAPARLFYMGVRTWRLSRKSDFIVLKNYSSAIMRAQLERNSEADISTTQLYNGKVYLGEFASHKRNPQRRTVQEQKPTSAP